MSALERIRKVPNRRHRTHYRRTRTAEFGGSPINPPPASHFAELVELLFLPGTCAGSCSCTGICTCTGSCTCAPLHTPLVPRCAPLHTPLMPCCTPLHTPPVPCCTPLHASGRSHSGRSRSGLSLSIGYCQYRRGRREAEGSRQSHQ